METRGETWEPLIQYEEGPESNVATLDLLLVDIVVDAGGPVRIMAYLEHHNRRTERRDVASFAMNADNDPTWIGGSI